MRLRIKVIVSVAASVVFLTACGGGGDKSPAANDRSTSPRSSETTEADLREAARKFNQAFLGGDTQGSFKYLSASCRKKHGVGGWGAQLALGKGMVESFSGVKAKDLELGDIKTRNVTSTSAEVSVDLIVKSTGDSFAGEDQADYSPWIVEEGVWRTTDCESFGEDSSDEVSLETARAWPAKWCSLDPNTNRDHVRQVMGEPTGKFDDQDEWDAHNFSFTAFYKNDGTVSQLDIGSTDSLTNAEKASITCEDTRHAD